MRTPEQIRGALASHAFNKALLAAAPKRLTREAKKWGKSEDWVKGYMAGVEFAYKWVLEMIK